MVSIAGVVAVVKHQCGVGNKTIAYRKPILTIRLAQGDKDPPTLLVNAPGRQTAPGPGASATAAQSHSPAIEHLLLHQQRPKYGG